MKREFSPILYFIVLQEFLLYLFNRRGWKVHSVRLLHVYFIQAFESEQAKKLRKAGK